MNEAKEWDLEEDDIDMEEYIDEDVPTPICINLKNQKRTATSVSIDVPSILRRRLKLGLKAVAWDDWSGRIFVSTLHDCAIHIIDLAQGPKESA